MTQDEAEAAGEDWIGVGETGVDCRTDDELRTLGEGVTAGVELGLGTTLLAGAANGILNGVSVRV